MAIFGLFTIPTLFTFAYVVGFFSQTKFRSVMIQLAAVTRITSYNVCYTKLLRKEKGFYAEANLDVAIRPMGPDTDVEQEVLSGRAQYRNNFV